MVDEISGALKNKDKVYLFMDNAGYHKNEIVKTKLKEANIEIVFNVSYKFEFNPIEKLWREYKVLYRKLLLDKML